MNVYDNDYHDFFAEDVCLMTHNDIQQILDIHGLNFNTVDDQEHFVEQIINKTIAQLKQSPDFEHRLCFVTNCFVTNYVKRVMSTVIAKESVNAPRCLGYFFERPGYMGITADEIATCISHIHPDPLGLHTYSVEATEVESTAIGFVSASLMQNDEALSSVTNQLIAVMNDMNLESEDGTYHISPCDNVQGYVVLTR